VVKQIEKYYRQHPKVRIYNNGKLVNIADTQTMQYSHIGDDGNQTSTHILVKNPR
jgi:N-acetyl-gamma-glutamylphosphate reductase